MKINYHRKLLFLLALVFLTASAAMAQTNAKTAMVTAKEGEQAIRSTPAYAELLLRRTELESVLEEIADTYTDAHPKMKETRYQLELIEKDRARLLTFTGGDSARMTLALGKMMVRRAELSAALWSLKTRFSETHPDVVRARRRVTTFDKAIAEILP